MQDLSGIIGDNGFKMRIADLAKIDPTKPNLRQVHLIQAELLDELY